MGSPFKTLKIVSTIYSVIGSIILTIGILIMLMVIGAFVLGREVTTLTTFGAFITMLNMALISLGCIVSGTVLLAQGEYLDLMLAVEDHLDEQTSLLRKLLKATLIQINEPD